MTRAIFRLKILRIEQVCRFELSWGGGQQLATQLDYPNSITILYQEWQRAYLSFYKSIGTEPESFLRGRVEAAGSLTASPIDWQAKLVQAEAKLLYEFHCWLRSGELYEMRAEIARTVRNLQARAERHDCVDIFLTCDPVELDRFPWEAWEIGTEFAATGKIRFARTPVKIRANASSPRQPKRRRARILAILGDDTGLNFQADRDAVKSLSPVAEVKFVGWQPGQDAATLKCRIGEAIADEQGWDGLFFAGHSNEAPIVGGELAIAPGVSMFIREIEQQLQVAKARGLQFAIFNSCNGLDIAAALINLGLSQVAIMREPIHNRVAQEFLLLFLRGLAEHKDVHDALLAACQYLKLDKNLTYPSAYLIPSLFCHPDAELFRILPFGFKQQLQRCLPTPQKAVALGTLLLLSLLPPVQDLLLESRIWSQAVYRDWTSQVPATSPPVLLVLIDQESMSRDRIDARKINPIDRTYLASLINRLQAFKSKVVGIDFVLNSPTEEDRKLRASVQTAANQNTWLVFGAKADEFKGEVGVTPTVANLNTSMQGYIDAFDWYVELPAQAGCSHACPFAYTLALAQALHQEPISSDLPQPRSANQTDFREQVMAYVNRGNSQNPTIAFLKQLRLHPVSNFSQWLQPILDFSIPPDRVYTSIAAWQLRAGSLSAAVFPRLQQQVVIIAPGGYEEAGVKPGEDNYAVPMAVAYWQERLHLEPKTQKVFPGAKAHAYMIHHLLTHHLVVPIPDLWMIIVAALLGKGTALVLLQPSQQRRWAIKLVGATVVYGLVGLQAYISTTVLLPWLLPSAAFWVYVLPVLRRKSHA